MASPEQLLGLPRPISELTDEELQKHLSQYFTFTRPKKPLAVLMKRATSSIAAATGTTVPKGTVIAPGGGTTTSQPMSALQEKIRQQMAAAGLDMNGKPLPSANKKVSLGAITKAK